MGIGPEWTGKDFETAVFLWRSGEPLQNIAAELKRTPTAVKAKLVQRGICADPAIRRERFDAKRRNKSWQRIEQDVATKRHKGIQTARQVILEQRLEARQRRAAEEQMRVELAGGRNLTPLKIIMRGIDRLIDGVVEIAAWQIRQAEVEAKRAQARTFEGQLERVRAGASLVPAALPPKPITRSLVGNGHVM